MTWGPTASGAFLVYSGNLGPVAGAVVGVLAAIVLTGSGFLAARRDRARVQAGQKLVGRSAGRVVLAVIVLAAWAAAGYLVATAASSSSPSTAGSSSSPSTAGSSPLSAHSVTAACKAYHQWALAQPAGGFGFADESLLATAVKDAPPGKVSTDLRALQADAAQASRGSAAELVAYLQAQSKVVSDCGEG
jgi:hypothetical protein